MRLSQRYYFTLAIGLFVSLVIYFSVFIYFYNVGDIFERMIKNNMVCIDAALLTNINFLRARRAEKNLVIYKDLKYKDEAEDYLKKANLYIKRGSILSDTEQDKELFLDLEENLLDYRALFNKLAEHLTASGATGTEEFRILSSRISELNTQVSENISEISNQNWAQITSTQTRIRNNFRNFSLWLTIVLILSLFIGYIVVFLFVKITLSRLDELSMFAEKMSRGIYDFRIHWMSDDEISRTAQNLNKIADMLKQKDQKT